MVVDFIGNHRSFLTKPQSLLYLLGQDLPPHIAIEKLRAGALELPEGCSISIETEALDLLASLVRLSQEDATVYEYVSFRDAHGRRPTAAELFAKGVGFKPIRDRYPSWFHFVVAQGDLSADEEGLLGRHEAWFGDMLRTKMTKAYKMTALRALVEGNALFRGMDVEENARRSFRATGEDLMLFRELREDEARRAWGAAFVRRWREEPLGVWARGESTSRPWFRLDGDTFVPTYEVAEADRDTFEAMTTEMVDLRIAEHRDRLLRRQSVDASQAPIVMSVSHASHRPILRFDRSRRPDIPEGLTPVEVNGEPLTLDFKKIAVNVATGEGATGNVLPEALRRLFGPSTGEPGIRHRARLLRTEEGWRLERDEAAEALLDSSTIIPFPRVPYYPDVQIACGALSSVDQQHERVQQIPVQTTDALSSRKHFVVRATGDSMNGGDRPIASGDLVLCEWTPGADAESIAGRAHVLVGHDMPDSSFAVIKVPVRTADGWRLESWNPDFPAQEIPAGARFKAVARVLGVVEEPGGLLLYGTYDRDAIAAAFGDRNNPSWRVGHRDVDVSGTHHTVLMVTLRKGPQTKIEHRYADRFLSASLFQWESQASTTEDSLKGRRIRGADGEPRIIHLFVQYESHQDFTYLGPVKYQNHEGEKPMRVRFELQQPLTEALWKMWG